MSDLFESKSIKPMLIGNNSKPYDDNDSIFELKFDGIRCIAYIDNNNVVLRNKRNKDVTNIYPELKDICKNINKKCILDGEVIVLKKGVPDFFSVQKRSLMTNSFKIKLVLNKIPVTFIAFDILYYDDKSIMDLPLIERKEILKANIKESKRIAISRYIENSGVKFFELAKINKLEGIVGKKKDSLYIEGIKTKSWKKIKAMVDEDLIVCGYDIKDNDINGLVLGIYDNNNLICRGKVSLGISKDDKRIILDFSKNNQIDTPYFDNYKNVVWLKLELVGIVEYMHETENHHMRQPIWKGLRFDKDISECKL